MEVLVGMVGIDDLDAGVEPLVAEVPAPGCPVAGQPELAQAGEPPPGQLALPAGDLQRPTPRRFSGQPRAEGGRRLPGGDVTRDPQLAILPASHQPALHLVPAVLVPHHRPVRLHDQEAGCRSRASAGSRVRATWVTAASSASRSAVPAASACRRIVSAPSSSPVNAASTSAASRNGVAAPSRTTQLRSPSLSRARLATPSVVSTTLQP